MYSSKKIKLIVMLSIMAVSIALFVVGVIILPDVITVQIKLSGEAGNQMSKYAGLILPLALTLVFSFLYYKQENPRHLIVAFVGFIVYALIFIFN